MLGRDFKIEMDFLRHQPPRLLYGGRIDRVGVECQEAILTVPVRSLAEIEPFRYYDVVVRRHYPPEALGLPLKIKILGAIALEPKNYIGYGRKSAHHVPHGFDGDGVDGGLDGVFDGNVEVIEEQIPAEIFDCTLFGFGNQAMLDDTTIWGAAFNTTPAPFIRFYVNDEGKFVIMPCETRCCEPRRLVVRRTEVIREPFKAHTLAVKRSATPYVRPQRFQEIDFWTQGNFNNCGCGDGRGFDGFAGRFDGTRW